VSKDIKFGEVGYLRLINGDELIARVETLHVGNLVLSDAMIIEESLRPDGSTALMLAKYAPFNRHSFVEVDENHVITYARVIPEIEKYYDLSREYSRKFVARGAVEQISQITRVMEAMIDPGSAESGDRLALVASDSSRILPSSNTVH